MQGQGAHDPPAAIAWVLVQGPAAPAAACIAPHSLPPRAFAGALLRQHIVYGLDALVSLAQACMASSNMPLLGEVVTLLTAAVAQGPPGSLPVPLADVRRAVQMVRWWGWSRPG